MQPVRALENCTSENSKCMDKTCGSVFFNPKFPCRHNARGALEVLPSTLLTEVLREVAVGYDRWEMLGWGGVGGALRGSWIFGTFSGKQRITKSDQICGSLAVETLEKHAFPVPNASKDMVDFL